MKRSIKIIFFSTIVAFAGYFLVVTIIPQVFFAPQNLSIPIQDSVISSEDIDRIQSGAEDRQEQREPRILVSDLEVPWDIVFIDERTLLIPERNGDVVLFDTTTNTKETIFTVPTPSTSEGGLLGMVLHPLFDTNAYVYMYQTYKEDGKTLNRVVRYVYNNKTFTNDTTIIEDIPGALYHDGGRIAFGPDDKLYVTTGDATKEDLAQDMNSYAGKILRMNDDGSVPDDNPFDGSYVYSLGHRNPQGLAWDSSGQLWSTEHGPSGLESGHDELNRITKGGNYGWPIFEGNNERSFDSTVHSLEDYKFPVRESGKSEAWAPAGLAYFDGTLYFGGLRGNALFIYDIEQKKLTRTFAEEFGRIRTTIINDNKLYFTTSNTDGRGNAQEGDDVVVVIEV